MTAADHRFIPYGETLPRVADDVFVADTARVIGDVVVGPQSSIWFGTVVRGDVHHIRIGARVNLQDMTMIHVTSGTHATVVHDGVTVGHRATLHGCTVEAGALIGMGATVLDAAVVGSQAMVGAGAVVTPGTQIPSGTLWLGAPAKYKRDLRPDEIAGLADSAAHYVALGQRYRAATVGTASR